jgi:hypothetical protein
MAEIACLEMTNQRLIDFIILSLIEIDGKGSSMNESGEALLMGSIICNRAMSVEEQSA